MDFFYFLKPAPFEKAIEDPKVIAKLYGYWRLRIFYSLYAGYVVYYFTRKSFTYAMPSMIDELGLSMADLGFLSTLLYVSYGFSKFFSSIISDRSNPRYLMSIALILTGLCNMAFGFSSSIYLFALFWTLNGLFQGCGWPPCTKQLTYWCKPSERGFWWSLHSTSHNVGGALIPLIAVYCAHSWGWRWALYVPGIIAIAIGLWLANRLRDIPQTLGLPPIEDFNEDGSRQVAAPVKEKSTASSSGLRLLSPSDILFKHVLINRGVWILSLSYFFVYVIRTAMSDWGALYLEKARGYDRLLAASSITWFEVGGFFGVLISGWASDFFFRGRRVPIMMGCAIGLVLSFAAFWYLPGTYLLDATLMALLGFFVFGPQLLVGLAASEFVDKKAACTANGFAGCFAYIGAAVTGYPLGKILDLWGWGGFFATMLACSLAIYAILIPLRMRKGVAEEVDEGLSSDLVCDKKSQGMELGSPT
ncbi:MAG: MFS transporter [Oligoflexales bacterium]|nr:MFS transporter [Oligoflexales bacterium]